MRPERAVADEAHGVDRLARAAGGDQHLQTVELAAGGAEARLDRGQQLGGLGQAADAPLARRAERAGAGLEHRRRRARAASRGSPAWPGARTSRRSWPERRSAVAGSASAAAVSRLSACPCGELGDRVGRWRARSGRRRRRSTSARCESGACSGGGSPGKAPRSGSRSHSVTRTGAPVIAANEAVADEARRRLGLDHAHGVAGLGGQARQLERLVGGDPAGDAEEDAPCADRQLSRGSGT